MSEIPYADRQRRLYEAMAAADLDAIVLNPGPSLVYLTGLHFHLSERPTVGIFVPGMPVNMVFGGLEIAKTKNLTYEAQVFPYQDDPATWAAAFEQAALAAQLDGKRTGVEPVRMRVLELRYLQAAALQAEFVPAEKVLEALRMCKDTGEVAAMRKAADIAQRALQATLPLVKIGMSERELASELTLQTFRAGSDVELPFYPIVSGGPNGANPHATPSDRPLKAGELLVIDWGAAYAGYFSDITRTFATGEVDEELRRIHSLTVQANAAGRAAVKPGISAGDVDRAARAVIEAGGYGENFFHRTGHGLGMEGHEAPYIYSANDLILSPGMTFTVEPGIYLPGRNGVRIEDDMVVTETGGESLTYMDRDIRVVG